jgi:glycosyltransferase involved in cell wall biosynthesis
VKLIIQIPCYNEAETLPFTLADLPDEVPGIDCIETIVIDDGSDDDTAAVARLHGVQHIIRHPSNLGLARAFQAGLDACLRLGADVIVHTDADHQYPGRFIPDLVAPIVERRADMVIGNRQVQDVEHFSALKKALQELGSWMVRTVSNTEVPDAPSGFRAFSREAALRFNILTRYSYTLETIIQAGKLGLPIETVPVETNPPTRPSRLQRNMWQFIKAQGGTILRLYAFYEPLRTFTYIALPFLVAGLALLLRFAYFYANQQGQGHIQSVIIGTGLCLLGVFVLLFGIQADIAGKHRQLTQEVLYRLKKLEVESTFQKEKAGSDEAADGHVSQ